MTVDCYSSNVVQEWNEFTTVGCSQLHFVCLINVNLVNTSQKTPPIDW